MEEITNEILRVFEDLQRMRSGQEQNGVGESDKDSYGYAFEPFDAFSTKPLDFSETALRLDIEAREMFAMLRTVNRHSPLFYKLSGQFEKMVSLLGSCCITKAVFEKQENEAFELLQDLTIDSLREMAAFNFRKCSAAFMDSRSCGKTNLGAFALSLRWAAVDKRLVATDAKIKSGQWSVVSDHNELPVAGCQLPEEGESEKLPVSAFAEKGRAFPVLQGTVRPGEIRNKKSEIRDSFQVSGVGCREEGDQWSVVNDQNELPVVGEIRNQKSEIRDDLSSQQETKGTVFADSALSQQNCPDRPGEELRVMREVLLGDALDRGDREDYEAAARAADDELEALWQELLLRDMRNGFPFLQKIGLYMGDPEDPPPEEAWNGKAVVPELAVT